MAKYHNSANGPRPCRAEHGGCPYAQAGEPHFDTQVEAQAAYEKKMAESFGGFESVRRSAAESVRQRGYQGADKAFELMEKAKASKIATDTVVAIRNIRDIPQKTRDLSDRTKSGFRRAFVSAKTQSSSFMAKAKTELRKASSESRDSVNAMLRNIKMRPTRPAPVMRFSGDDSVHFEHISSRVIDSPATIRTQEPKPAIGLTRYVRSNRLRIGDRLEGGKKVTSIGMRRDGTIYATTVGDDGSLGSLRMNPSDKVKTEVSAHDIVDRFKKSGLYERVSKAAELQRESFRILTQTSERLKDSNMRRHESLASVKSVYDRRRYNPSYLTENPSYVTV